MSDRDIRKQMEAVARELWGEARAKELAEQIVSTAATLVRIDAFELRSSDDFDYLERL
ncbi:MAG: hypothetical protein AB7O60_06710 [Variibacter sp.]